MQLSRVADKWLLVWFSLIQNKVTLHLDMPYDDVMSKLLAMQNGFLVVKDGVS